MKKPPESRKGIPRPNLAALLSVPKRYVLKEGTDLMTNPEFSLVNETPILGEPEKPGTAHHDYTRDQLIAMIGLAWPEFLSFVREHDEIIKENQVMSELMAELYYKVTGIKPAADSNFIEDMTQQATFGRQCEDVLRNIANNVPVAACKATAQKFLERAPTIGSRIIVLDKANAKPKEPDTTGNPTSES